MKNTEPEEEETEESVMITIDCDELPEEECWLEDRVEDANEERIGEGEGVERVVVEEEQDQEHQHPPLLHGPVRHWILLKSGDEEDQDTQGEEEEQEPKVYVNIL